ncbi:MAG TPA: WD40 repeat domain-containing serine/threonine-protein kinase, partial [Kofleriaceae bacterium]|nr:WD40 repeat domain-containing serine/threonine-protein kinase [Kofleriaceae bacterium]
RVRGPEQRRDPERYEVIGEHGRGGLGRVARAHDHDLDRDIAIKELLARDPVREVRFLREALITARLEHPGIVPVYEAGRWPDGTPFYAMKLVAGRPLNELIAERVTVAERIGLLHHVIAVADAIAYAHGRNIIHRDLKPSNVVVGDFGETIVIDWGLAKDLSVSEELACGSGAFGPPRDDGLTEVGAVLGTPAYMAPEQERGEVVDQRADVFAIGAMLWELCALERVPPMERGLRHRMLRRAGIDQDLIAIIDKALAPDPDRRYPDAGALAADLKAFKSGARIAARSYSLPALLAHWTRRHRTLAASVAAAAALAATGSVWFVRDIAAERDRADGALRRAESANAAVVEATRATQAAYNDLSLRHAELLLASDPTAAWEVLRTYRGPDQTRANLLKAKAEGLGIARVRASVHKDTVYRVQPLSSGALLSISEDGTIAITTIDGSSSVLAANAPIRNVTAFSRARELLAYACRPAGVCVVDPVTRSTYALATPGYGVPSSIDLSPGGDQLVAGYGDRIVVWRLAGARAIRGASFDVAGARRVVHGAGHVIVDAGRRVVLADPDTGAIRRQIELSATALAADGERVVLGTERGEVVVAGARGGLEQSTPYRLCSGRVTAIALLAGKHAFAYACQDGAIGIRDVANPDKVVMQAHDPAASLTLASSTEDRYVVFGGQRGSMRVYDTVTDILTSYKGQIACLTAVSGSAPGFPYFAAGDDDGYVRIWGPPQGVARTIIKAGAPLYDTAIADDGTVVGIGEDPVLRWWKDDRSGQVPAHDRGGIALRRSPDPARLASFGFDGDIVLWDVRRVAPVRRLHAGPMTSLAFVGDGSSLVSSGQDGRLLLWAPEPGMPAVLAQFSLPLVGVEALRGDDVVVAERGGSIWRLSTRAPDQRQRVRSGAGESVSRLVVTDDGRWLGVGTSSGDVVLYSTSTWQPAPIMKARGPIRSLAFSPDASQLAAVSKDGYAYLLTRPAAGAPPTWRALELPARDAKFSPDGRLLAITLNEGGVLFYGLRTRSWRYIALPAVDVFRGQFSAGGARYATVDGSGRVTLFDLTRISD